MACGHPCSRGRASRMRGISSCSGRWSAPGRPRMFNRWMLAGLLAAVAAGTGCHGMGRAGLLCPGGPGCDPTYCPAPCTTACGPACGPACPTGCEVACEDPCGAECCPPCPPCHPTGPLTWIFGLLSWRPCWDAGCGEWYWGDWCSHPPHCCDPCDRCGNWIGSSPGTGYSSAYPAVGYGGTAPYVVEGYPGMTAPGTTQDGCSDCGSGQVVTPDAPARPVPAAEGVTPANYRPMRARPHPRYRAPVQR